ncbi:MAG TPA: HAMP domain-containing sensor histidine kinase, partial [Segetibacter sp.]
WVIFFAASISGLIIYQNNEVEVQQNRKVAERLASEADPTAQYLFNAGIADIDSTFLSNNLSRLTSEATNKIIKDSLSSQYFSVNSNRYNTRLYTFDDNNRPLYNEDSLTYIKLRSIISRSRKTNFADLYYFEKDVNVFSFIYFKEIFDNSHNTKGYLFLVADPKKYKSLTVYPELFKQVDDVASDYDLTYAIYNKGDLVRSNGDYNFLSHIPLKNYPKGVYNEVKRGNNRELWYNAGSNKLVITVADNSVSLEFITLFAYLFGSFLFVVVMFQIGSVLIMYKFKFKHLRNSLKFNIKNQIQGAIIFISIFSFLVIGASTISFYINRFGQTNRERLVKAIKILANEIEVKIATNNFSDSGNTIDETGANSKLERTINEISEIHNVDANFYDLQGILKASTQPDIYKKQVLSKMMDPVAFGKLHYNKEIQLIQEEHVSRFSFLSIYVPVNDEHGYPYAYLNMPYLNTQKELNQEISNFLVTLINLNAFIFVIAGAISVLLTNRITKSFSLIASKMKEVNLGKANEKIIWNTNDEIGSLVSEYNKMVKKLEESAQALAKSEREGAWREMARQVAHEIKNPLTPMKLSIQYLQKSIQENHPNTQELSKKVSATLVEQIDQLAKIASDFSQFANITQVRTELFDIKEIINSLVNLYSSNEKVNIVYNPVEQAAIISADRNQINRLFTNLFQNAIEASEENADIDIDIDISIDGNKLRIDFADHGCGISAEKQDKIFTPNFTTKSSGTGLGLAISKGIVENANGRIWFDTKEGAGTIFHVLLPLVGLPDNNSANA